MNLKKIAPVYTIVIGVMMIGMWVVLLATGQVAEVKTEPIYLIYHLTAEFLTGISLIIGGVALLKGKEWGRKIYYLSMGLLLYAILNAGGFYAQIGDVAMIIMFSMLLITAMIILIFSNKKFNL